MELGALYVLLAAPAGSHALGWAHGVLEGCGMQPWRLSRAGLRAEIQAREVLLGHLEAVSDTPSVLDPPRGFI